MQSPDPGISLGSLFSARPSATPAAATPKRADGPTFEDSLSQASDRTEPVQRSNRTAAEQRARDDSPARVDKSERPTEPATTAKETRNEPRDVSQRQDDRASSYARARLFIAEPVAKPEGHAEVVPVIAPQPQVEVESENLPPVESEFSPPAQTEVDSEPEHAIFHIQPWPLDSTTDTSSPISSGAIEELTVVTESTEVEAGVPRPNDLTFDPATEPQLSEPAIVAASPAIEPVNVSGNGRDTPAVIGSGTPELKPQIGPPGTARNRAAEPGFGEVAHLEAAPEATVVAVEPQDLLQGIGFAQPTEQVPEAQQPELVQQAAPPLKAESFQRLETSSQSEMALPLEEPQQIRSAQQPDPPPIQHPQAQLKEPTSTPGPAGVVAGQDVRPETVVGRPVLDGSVTSEPTSAEKVSRSRLEPFEPTGRGAADSGVEDSFASPSHVVPEATPMPRPDVSNAATSNLVRDGLGTSRRAIGASLVAASTVAPFEETGEATTSGGNSQDFDVQSFSSFQTQLTESSRNLRVSRKVEVTPTQLAQMPSEIVARARTLADNETAELEIQLDPPELGQLKIQLRRLDGEIAARITVTDPAAFELLQHELQELRQNLEQSDIAFSSVELEQEQQQGRRAFDREQHDRVPREDVEPALRETRSSLPTSSQQTIDIRV